MDLGYRGPETGLATLLTTSSLFVLKSPASFDTLRTCFSEGT